MRKVQVETDVLIIGGGLAGCMAAIRGAEFGLKVTLVEKGNALRSGQAGSGIDHLWAYIPPVHEPMGYTIDDLVKDHFQVIGNGFARKEILHLIARESYSRVLDLERFGLNFRFQDGPAPERFRVVYQFHSVPSSFNFEGRWIKPRLAQEVKRRGVSLINRVMVTDLLYDGGHVAGALGVSTRRPNIYLFKAKAVVLATGRSTRLSRNVTGVPFNMRICPSDTGDGKAMAFRAGLPIVNMEFFSPRRLAIAGFQVGMGAPRSTFQPAGSLVGREGNVVVPRTSFYDWNNLGKEKVNPIEERKKFLERRKRDLGPLLRPRQAQGPLYLDCTGGTEEEIRYIEWSISHEGHGFLLIRHMQEQGIDLRRDKIEFGWNDRELAGTASAGLWVDGNLETELKGLWAAGDEVGGVPWASGPGAIAMGWHAGGMAATHAKGGLSGAMDKEKVEILEQNSQEMLSRKEGDTWQEVELSLENIMDDYCGELKSEPLLRAGLERIEGLRKGMRLKAKNPHELQRCFEVRSLIDNAEMILRASLERRESRALPFGFLRSDFPDQDDEDFFAFLGIRREGDGVQFVKFPIDSGDFKPRRPDK